MGAFYTDMGQGFGKQDNTIKIAPTTSSSLRITDYIRIDFDTPRVTWRRCEGGVLTYSIYKCTRTCAVRALFMSQ